MKSFRQRFTKHKFELFTLAFGLMILPPTGMYLAAQRGASSWIWGLLVVVVLGNLLALGIK